MSKQLHELSLLILRASPKRAVLFYTCCADEKIKLCMITQLASERVGTWSQAAAPRAGVVIAPLYHPATPSYTWLPGLFSHPG